MYQTLAYINVSGSFFKKTVVFAICLCYNSYVNYREDFILVSIRIILLALGLFLLVYLTDRNKTLSQKGGRLVAALLLLLFNVFAEVGQLSILSQHLSQYNVDKIYVLLKDFLHTFGLSTSSFMTLQMIAVSMLAMFTLIFNIKQRGFYMEDPDFKQQDSKEIKNEKGNDASKLYVMRQVCVCAKMRN